MEKMQISRVMFIQVSRARLAGFSVMEALVYHSQSSNKLRNHGLISLRHMMLEYQAVRTQYRLDEGTYVAYDEKSSYVHYVHGRTFGRT
jgi:hypothetical protein